MSFDRKQFEQIYKENYRQMYRVAYCIVEDEEESRDAVSQVFAQMWQKQPEIATEAITGYLLTATRNQCLHTLHRRQQQEEAAQEWKREMLSPKDRNQEELLREVQRVIEENLTEQDRKVLDLHVVEELTYSETAQRLVISASAVNKHVTQSLSKLRNLLNRKQQ